MAWVSAVDVIDSWIGTGAPNDTALVETWIARAERMIRRNVPDLQDRIDAEAELDPPSTDLLDLTKDVVIGMVTRVFRNPEGKRSIQSASGPLSESVTFGGDTPGGLVMTSEESDLLSGFRPGESFVIDLIAGHQEAPVAFPW